MKRVVLIISTAVMVACNNNTDKKSGHEAHSTTMQDSSAQPVSTGTSEMKMLMDKMMTQMHGQEQTGNIDIDYANMMLQHHQGAVDMARLQENKGSNMVLKEFSRKVIADQEKEIAIMGKFISESPAIPSPEAVAFKQAMDSSMQSMMSAGTKIYNDIDKDFVAQMIPHHQSAVDMANAYLRYGSNEQLKKLSRDIVSSQSKEIGWLKEWLGKNG